MGRQLAVRRLPSQQPQGNSLVGPLTDPTCSNLGFRPRHILIYEGDFLLDEGTSPNFLTWDSGVSMPPARQEGKKASQCLEEERSDMTWYVRSDMIMTRCASTWRGVAWRGLAWRGAAWHDATRRDATRRDAMWCGRAWRDVDATACRGSCSYMLQAKQYK